jgi:hypothetical protein
MTYDAGVGIAGLEPAPKDISFYAVRFSRRGRRGRNK